MTALQGELRDTKLEFLLDISGEIIRKWNCWPLFNLNSLVNCS